MARIRTFIGVDVGPAIVAAAGKMQQLLAKTGATVKWVEPANLHVTLVFLGEVDDRELASLCRAVAKAAKRETAFPLRIAGVGAFPNLRRPKTIWGGIAEGAEPLRKLHEQLETPLIDLGCYRREERAYSPHLTLGRVNSDADGELLAAEIPKHADWSGGNTVVEEVLVYSSELRRNGPEYTVIARAPLGVE